MPLIVCNELNSGGNPRKGYCMGVGVGRGVDAVRPVTEASESMLELGPDALCLGFIGFRVWGLGFRVQGPIGLGNLD